MSELIKSFKTALFSSQAPGSFHAAVSGRIYHDQAPQNSAMPLAVWLVLNSGVDTSFTGKNAHEMSVEVTIYATRGALATAMDAEAKLFALIHNTTTAAGAGFTIGATSILCLSRSVHRMIENAHAVSDTFRIRAFDT